MALTKISSGLLADDAISTASLADGIIQAAHLHSSHGITTANIAEGSNLYYTNARADARISAADTDDLSEGSSNLYHTTARARAAVSVGGSLAYNSSTGVVSFTQRTDGTIRGLVSVTDSGGDGSLAYNNSTGVITYTGPSASEVRAHLSAGTGVTYSGGAISIGQSVATSATPTFGNITLGTISSGNITTTGYLRGPASFTIDPATHGDNTGTVVIAGNLQVDGTTTTINSTTVAIDDLNFSIATDAADSAAANGAGITIGGASATMLYTHATTSWDFNKPLNVTGNIGVSGTVDGVDIAARDAILTSTTTTAGAALPKAGGTMTGDIQAPGIYVGSTNTSYDFYNNGTTYLNGATIVDDNLTSNKYIMTGGSQIGQDYTYLKGDSTTTASLTLRKDASGADSIDFLQLRNDSNNLISKITGPGVAHFTGAEITGTTNITGGLNVNGAHINVDAGMSFQWGDSHERIEQSDGHLEFFVNNSEAMTLDTNGLGIGVISPQSFAKLQIQGSGGAQDGAHQALYVHAPDETAGEGVGIRMSAASGSHEAVGIIGMVNNASGNAGSMTFHTYNLGSTIPEVMRITNTGNVGIGEVDPDNKLDVNFSITGEGSQEGGIKIQNARGYNNDIAPLYFGVHGGTRRTKAAIGLKREGSYGIGSLIFALDSNGDDANVTFANDEKMRITSAGNVGIGTDDTYSRKFAVEGTGDLMLLRSTNSGAGGAQLDLMHDSSSAADNDSIGIINFTTDDRQYASIKGVAHSHSSGHGLLQFGVRQNTSTYNHTAMTIDENGNVGIGTTSPTVLLDIYNSSGWGGLDVDGTAGGEIRIQKAGSMYGQLFATDTHGFVINAQGGLGDILFQSSGSTKMTLLDSGNLGIGTSTGVSSPVSRLNVRAANNHTTGSDREDLVTFHQGISAWQVGRGAGIRWVGDTARTMAGISSYIFGAEQTGLAFETGGANSTGNLDPTTRMVIDHNGKVGIGENDPEGILHIKGAQPNVVISNSTQDGTSTKLSLIEKHGLDGWLGGFIRYNGSTNNMTLGTIHTGTTETHHIYLPRDGSGDVKIGLGGSGGDLMLQPLAKLYLDAGGDTYIQEVSGNNMGFAVGGNVKMNITSDGLDVSSGFITDTYKPIYDTSATGFAGGASADTWYEITGGPSEWNGYGTDQKHWSYIIRFFWTSGADSKGYNHRVTVMTGNISSNTSYNSGSFTTTQMGDYDDGSTLSGSIFASHHTSVTAEGNFKCAVKWTSSGSVGSPIRMYIKTNAPPHATAGATQMKIWRY